MGNFFGFISEILHYNLFPLGEAKITPLSLIYVLGFSILLFWASKKIRDLLTSRLLAKTHLDIGAQQAIGTISRYLILFLGFLVILQTVGINLTTLNVLAGAVGIGVGFGLQNVASNFIAGIIILFERPVKIGDRIEVDGSDGKVVSVGARSTVVKTNDNITIIIPNSKLITEDVINWTYDSRNPRIRLRVPVGVSYDSDVNLVKRLLCEVGTENPDVLQDPEPTVRLIEFGDNSLNFELWVWSKAKLHRKTVLLSDLNFAIWEKFKANNIEIPFPQRDLNFRSGHLKFDKNAVVFSQQPEGNSQSNGVYES
ncbi:MAG: mechanosensitive ion channel [Acidobacteriota bacterium]|nr:mechanosensitive ion channel [Acidobacteriota bacterium]